MNYYETFDPAILLGDRLGLSLYVMFVEATLAGKYQMEGQLYRKFINHFPGERRLHTPERFRDLINAVKSSGFNPRLPVYANPDEYSLIEGSHRCSIAIQLGIHKVPYNLRFQDDRVDNQVFRKIFSASELELLLARQDEYIDRCNKTTAFRCRVRRLMRENSASFQAPFSSRTKIPCLRPYQSLEAAGIAGKRPSAKRMKIYELAKHLRKDMVGLEIGCNVGFFSLTVAPYLSHLDAFDVDASYIEVARLAQRYCSVDNCSFTARSLREFIPERQYDLVISTAVHGWSGLKFSEYLALLDRCAAPRALLLFESHEIDSENQWDDNRKQLLDRFSLLESGLIDDVDRSMYASEMREFLVLRKS